MFIVHLESQIKRFFKKLYSNMKLREYLEKTDITWEAFARKARLTQMTIYNIIEKRHIPSGSTLKKIVRASGGEVRLEDLINP